MLFIVRLCLYVVGFFFGIASLGLATGGDWPMCLPFAAIAGFCLHRAAVGFGSRRRFIQRRPPGAGDAFCPPLGTTGTRHNGLAAVASLSDFDFAKIEPRKASRSRKSPKPQKRKRQIEGDLWVPRGHYEVAVFGESRFQSALLRAVGGSAEEFITYETMAEVVCAPQGPYDFPETGDVFVAIGGARVGELAGSDAISFRRRLMRYGRKGRTTRCHAQIRGGGRTSEGTAMMFGVWLDIAPFR